MARSGKHTAMLHQVRIIGGQWRGRKLSFTPAEGLRPTGDRIRETLFNWLAPAIEGARCVDLFAGSGALGLEALSRGASHCDFVDSSNATLARVSDHLKTLAATDRGRCHPVSSAAIFNVATQPYDIVFIDPPFTQQLVGPICDGIGSKTAVERRARWSMLRRRGMEPPLEVPLDWSLHREKVAGAVSIPLVQR